MILQYYNSFISLKKHEELTTVSLEELEKLQELDYKTFITILYILNKYEAQII